MTHLTPFGPEIWVGEGPTVDGMAGFHYPTRMLVIRLSGGHLLAWSPTTLTPDLRAEIDALGPLGYLVAPNDLHHLALAQWQAAYPDAHLFGTSGLREKRPDLRIDSVLGAQVPNLLAAEMDMRLIDTRITPEAVFFHRRSATVIVTDLLQQLPPGWFSGWRALVARLDLMTAPQPSVPRKFRLALRDRTAARAAVTDVLAWPADRLVIAHGPLVHQNARAVLARAFAWLT